MNKKSEEIVVAYYRLKEPKRFTNGNTIEGNQLLIKSNVEKSGLTLYNTVENISQVRWFWAREEEVEFEKEVEEEWSAEDLEVRLKMIEDSWL